MVLALVLDTDTCTFQVVATYIATLRCASAAAVEQPNGKHGRKKALRMDFGEGGPSVGLASASTTSSIQSSTGSLIRDAFVRIRRCGPPRWVEYTLC
jgi:hypothetical protein